MTLPTHDHLTNPTVGYRIPTTSRYPLPTKGQRTMTLSYKQLQAALKVFKADGQTDIKLNAKQNVLQAEYDHLNATATTLEGQCTEATECNLTCEVTTVTSTRPHILTSEYNALPIQGRGTGSIRNERHSKLNDSYPFCSNAVTALNSPTLPTLQQEQELATSDVITRTLPAMNKKYAPSWLTKPVTVYVVDGVDYLPCELDMALKGETCELTCEALATATKHEPTQVPQTVKAKLTYSAEPASPYFIDTSKATRYTKGLGTTELQCARNVEDAISATKRGLAAVISIAKGFNKAQVQRALEAGALAA